MNKIILMFSFCFNIFLFGANIYVVDYSSQADFKTYLVDYPSQADLKIYIVDYPSQAGWNKSHKLIGRIR